MGTNLAKSERSAKNPNTLIRRKKSEMTESILAAISCTIESTFSMSTKVTCGPLAERICFFHDSVSIEYAERKYVFGAFSNVFFSN